MGSNVQALCVRSDLGMSKGKIAAQCAHAAIGAYRSAEKTQPASLQAWEMSGQTKVVLRVPSEDILCVLWVFVRGGAGCA